MSIFPLEYLRHIMDEIEYLIDQSTNLSKEDFLGDETLKRAFVRSIEIIGEAVKKIPSDFKQKYSHIEWRAKGKIRVWSPHLTKEA